MPRTSQRVDAGAAACCSGREACGASSSGPRLDGVADARSDGAACPSAGATHPRRRRGGASARAAALGACAALAALSTASAQTDFTDAPAGDYLTFCMEAATGYLPTGACADASYDTLQRYFATALTDPFAESNATTLAGVTAICNAGCDSQLLTLAQKYVGAMPTQPGGAPVDNSWCATVTGVNTAPLLGNSLPFLCLQNEADSYCVVEVGKALYEANLLQQLVEVIEGGAPFNPSRVDTGELCRAMFETGCCAQTFIDVVQSMLLMTCHPDTASALQTLFQGCSPALKPGCQYDFIPFEMPANCPEGGLVLPRVGTTCPIPTGSCPVTQCEFLCAIVAADPPGFDDAAALFGSTAGAVVNGGAPGGVSDSGDAAEALGDSSGDGEAPSSAALASRELSLAQAASGRKAHARRAALSTTAWLGAAAAAVVAVQAAARAGAQHRRRDPSGTELATRWAAASPGGASGEFSWPPQPVSRV